MRPFGEAKSISGHQTLQLKDRGSFHTPCLPTVPRGRARRSRATGADYPLQGDKRRPSPGTSRPTSKTGETREENPIGSQRIHSTCSLTHFFFIFLWIRDLFSARGSNQRSRFDSTQPNDTSNTNDLVTRI
ncbi:hypothetical protein LUZ60_001902 [Juncus effusus]|nr:hypothetical protein LUZ60_001902 [Juncus effusus]